MSRSIEPLSSRDISAVLGRPERHNEWDLWFCPLHGDGKKHGGRGGRSLGLSKSGKLICFAGCPPKDVAQFIRGKLGERSPSSPEYGWDLIEVYEYRDPAGKLLGYKGRWHQIDPSSPKGYQKKFAWRTPDGDWKDGLKKSGLSVADMPLYRSERLAGHSGHVWFVEGERCVHALEEQGEVAVCPSGSASQVNFGAALEVLRGRRVYLWPDNDEPGQKLAAAVSQQLRALGAKITPIVAPVGPGGDAVDYFRSGGTLESLLRSAHTEPLMTIHAPDCVTIKVPTADGPALFEFKQVMKGRKSLDAELFVQVGDSDSYWQRVNILSNTARDQLTRTLKQLYGDPSPGWVLIISTAWKMLRDAYYAANPVRLMSGQPDVPPAEFLVDGLAVVGGGVILFGPPGRGKSQTCLLLAVSVDAGISSVFPVRQQAPALYINLERSEQSMAARLARVNEALGLPADRPLAFLNARGKALPDILERTREAIAEHNIGFVVLDSISRAGMGDLNDNQTANAIVDGLNSLGVAWLGIAHTPRKEEDHVYGSVHQEAGADVMAKISTEESSNPYIVPIKITITKANDFRATGEYNLKLIFDHEGLASAECTSWVNTNDAFARVRQSLRNMARTVDEIGKMTGLPPEAIERVLARQAFVQLPDGRFGLAV